MTPAAFFWFGVHIALNALMLLILAMNVSRLRITLKVAHGDGGQIPMKAAIRAHANGIEHVTIFSLNLLTLVLVDAPSSWTMGLTLGFFGFRLLHAYGMLTTAFNARRLGAAGTYLLEASAVVALLLQLLRMA